MKLVPLNNKVILKRLEAEGKSKGGIYLPDTAKEKPMFGKVLAVGDGKELADGTRRACTVKEGDTVLFTRYSGHDTTVEHEDYLIVSDDDILAILK